MVSYSINREIAHNGGVEVPFQVNLVIWGTSWLSSVQMVPNTAAPECGGICKEPALFFSGRGPLALAEDWPFFLSVKY